MVRFFCLATCVWTIGCANRVEVDVAEVCLSERDTLGSVEVSQIEVGQPLTVFAEVIKGCHTEDLELFCTATVEGDTIVVTTETTWRRTEPLAMSCEAIAYVAQTSCQTDVALEEGTYAVVYADQILDVVVPSSGDAYDCLVP